MRLKPVRPPALDAAGAEDLAAGAMAFLTAEPTRLSRFLRECGMEPDDLAAALSGGGKGALIAGLEHIVSDESLLLVFASEVRRPPEEIVRALAFLQGPIDFDGS